MKPLVRLLLPLCGACCLAVAADSVRVTVVTRSSQLFPEALAKFEATHGKGLLDLRFGDGTAALPLADAGVVLFYYGGQDVYRRHADSVRSMAKRGGKLLAIPRDNADRLIGTAIDAQGNEKVSEYWTNGGVDNIAAMFAYLYRMGGGDKPITVPSVQPLAATGLFHPLSPMPFRTLEEYLEWERSNSKLPQTAPRAAVMVYQTSYKNRDLEVWNALIKELERQQIRAVGVYGWPVHSMSALLQHDGMPAFDILLANNLSFLQSQDAPFLEKLGVPVLNVMTSRVSEKDWAASPQGVTAERVGTLVATPERAGAIDALMVGATEINPATKAQFTVPIAERIQTAAARAKRWLALQRKPNIEKRIAILYYNAPPGKGNIGASYLNVPTSLAALLREMREAGYQVGHPAPDEKQLLAMLEKTGRNIEEWAPGELEAMLTAGHVELVSMRQYKQWFAELPAQFRNFVQKGWGRPEESKLMTVTMRDGQKYFVIPGIRLGNIFLGPQPLRSTFDRANESLHNITIPPPHIYVAAYLWYRKLFRADAIAHLGRHGTLEFLPGKNMGQAGWDSSEVVMGDVPNPYVYIIDGGGESTIARRRSGGVMLGHLTPLSVPAGEQKDNAALREAFQNYEQTRDTSPSLAAEYQKTVIAEVRRLKLDQQLKFDIADWPTVRSHVDEFLEATEAGPIPAGVHTLGTLPREEIQREALLEYLKATFSQAELRRVQDALPLWAKAIFEGTPVEVPRDLSATLRDKVLSAIHDGEAWINNLRQSQTRELKAWLTVLNGRYLASGSTGDPLRTPSSIPTGRNLHDFDPALIPTKAAWEMGKKLAAQMLEKFRAERGRAPEKISMVLWYGETIRHQGAMESEALYLMGVEPKWNSRGIVDGFRVIPDAELGRPRIDVVFTIAGIYRDGLADKILLLDKAAKLAAAQGNNAIRRHTEQAAARLKQQGIAAETAEKLAQARVFGSAPGDYGAGISKMAKQSKDADNTGAVTELYTGYMGHAYSADLWGEHSPQAFREQLKGNDAIVHSRSTSVYGVLDNDDFFEFAGGLNLATKSANGGSAPAFYVNDVRRQGRETVTGIQTFIAQELNSRNWNPKWIEEMKRSGYAGAREMMDNLENLYGWQMTSAEHVDGSFWQNSYDVYVADKHGLELQKFFDEENPHSRQMMLARLLEVDRQGAYKFTSTERERMVREYVQSVNTHGVGCSANTCGNQKLHDFISGEARLVSGLGSRDLQQFARSVQNATAPPRAHIAAAKPAKPASRATLSKAAGRQVVSGYRMRETRLFDAGTSARPSPAFGWGAAALAGLVAMGAVREAFRSRRAA